MTDKGTKKGKEVSRRDFLKGFGGGALGTAVFPKLLVQESGTIETKQGHVPVFEKKTVTLTVNGKGHDVVVEPNETLLDVLREKLDITGPKRFCNQGECGACTVLLDGKPVYACLYLAIRAEGRQITTIEGLAEAETLHPIQEAFIEKDGYQCGFCTPGFILSSAAFLKNNSNPQLEDIKQALSGNLCRCGNYFKIYDAVSAAAEKMRRL